MGQCCVRFRKLDDLPLDAIGRIVARVTPAKYIEAYKASRKKQRPAPRSADSASRLEK
jgi:hypothetical protein